MSVRKTASQIAAEKASSPSGKRVAVRKHFHCPNCLKQLRDKAKLSLGDVESGSGVGSQTVKTAEEGGDISLSRAMALAAFYETPIEEIWSKGFTEKEEPAEEAAA